MELEWHLNLVNINLALKGGELWLIAESGEMSISEKDLNKLLIDYFNEHF